MVILDNGNVILTNDIKWEKEWKAGLKFTIQKTKMMASGPITSLQIDGEQWK